MRVKLQQLPEQVKEALVSIFAHVELYASDHARERLCEPFHCNPQKKNIKDFLSAKLFSILCQRESYLFKHSNN